MADLLKTRHQPVKVREMRSEVRKLDNALAQIETAVGRNVVQQEQGITQDTWESTLFDAMQGWLHSMLESYIAIAYAYNPNWGRRLTAELGMFSQTIREREEQIVARDLAAFWKQQGL